MSEPASIKPASARLSVASRPGKRAADAREKEQQRPVAPPAAVVVERVQTGLRIEKRMLKVLKALAEYHDIGLGDLVEGIVLYAFDGRCAFGPDSLQRIADIKHIYGLDLDAGAAHRLIETDPNRVQATP